MLHLVGVSSKHMGFEDAILVSMRHHDNAPAFVHRHLDLVPFVCFKIKFDLYLWNMKLVIIQLFETGVVRANEYES